MKNLKNTIHYFQTIIIIAQLLHLTVFLIKLIGKLVNTCLILNLLILQYDEPPVIVNSILAM